ncbi:MAG: SGNH/GDSL hydrolase family protein [Bacilli bacterium]|nr:SGNH/GDSL hydrolase family protein [Bacilli bacterium]
MKKLDKQTIKSIAFGYETVNDDNGSLRFERMHQDTIEAFEKGDFEGTDFVRRAHATSNIVLDFETDSKNVKLHLSNVTNASSRNFCYVDVLVNNNLVGHFGEEPSTSERFDIEFSLYETPARVTICFPCLFRLDVEDIEIEDGAFIKPMKKNKTFLFYGDSITQGYDVRTPSLSYSSILGRAFDAEVKNMAVGGSFFDPGLLVHKYQCDAVFVAYGTNDWRHKSLDRIKIDCDEFLRLISEQYRGKPIFVLLPYYRHDYRSAAPKGNPFLSHRKGIKKTAEKYGLTVIDTFDFYPKEEYSFSDKHLHPNEFGNTLIAANIYKAVRKTLK